ncbi:MAG: hypothetical protein KDB24_13465 [Microthrixaceae bacterium]|nr:hypothetical protein [Microthrixaceae bacterium]
MTSQETFKKRIRARMAKTGERYGAARRALIVDADRPTGPAGERVWASEPEHTDEVIRTNTGRGWNEWCDLIDAWPGHVDGHPAVAAWLLSDTDLNGWWSHAVTVGWERITGRRVANQRADGTFEGSKSKTVTVDVVMLRNALFDDEDRADLFPGLATEMRSKPSTKVPRVAFPEGSVLFDLVQLDDGRARITISHGKLDSPEAVDEWKDYWAEWLEAIAAQ